MQLFAAMIVVATFFGWRAKETSKSGKVLRDASRGSGLLMIEGRQYPFSMTREWKSDLSPQAGMAVEAEFDRDGRLVGVRPVSQSGSEQRKTRHRRIS
jgi:hypothetical protein